MNGKRFAENPWNAKTPCMDALRLEGHAAPHPARALAHDIMNMLGVIRAHAELALDEAPDSAAAAEHAEGILEACARAAELARRLWPAARGDNNPAPRCGVSLPRLAADVLCWLHPTLPPGVKVKLRLDPDTPPVRVDVPAMEQALYNLMRNACQAMPGGGALRINCEPCAPPAPDAAPGPWCRISVQDTGPGMTRAAIANLGRAGFTTRAGSGGRGIGIASVLDTVRAHGGLLRASSNGRGAMFSIWLPCDEVRSNG